jgi:membrane protease YdiL (CAAX protease family)
MTKPTHWIKGHQLIAFFTLTFAITWGVGALAIFLPGQFRDLFGELTDSSPVYFLAVAAPTISATLVTWVGEGRAGLAALYARLIRWRFGIRWYALVLIGIPALGWLVSRLAGPTPLEDVSTPAILFALLLNLLISGPLGEELGWRGFALPRLLKQFSPLVASLILGAIWGVWHLPSFFLSGMVQSGLSLPIFLLCAPCLSILITWVFEHTGESVLITVLFHYMVNFSASIIGAPLPAIALTMLVGVVLVLALDKRLGWFRKA